MTETTWIPGEVPPADDATAAYWEVTREHLLTVQSCAACGTMQHPPCALCTGCGSMESLSQAAAAGSGVVDSFTLVNRASRPNLATPCALARVRLAEGPIVLTRHEPAEPAGGWQIGDAVRVAWTDLPDGRALTHYRRVDEEN